MHDAPIDDLTRSLGRSLGLVLAVVLTGIVGYLIIGWPDHGLLDAVYMTVITLTTVGYGEVIDLNARPVGRIFTILLLCGGVGAFLNFVSALTAFWVDGQANRLLWRNRMKRDLSRLDDHIVVCGGGHTGMWICRELIDTRRPFAVIEGDPDRALALPTLLGAEVPTVIGDATDDAALRAAGVDRASSVVCCVSNDRDNLIVALSARLVSPKARIIVRCVDERMVPKILQAGADKVVSPNQIGGLRMISEAVRPGAVDYLDRMLRDRDSSLRVESTVVEAGSRLAGRTVADLLSEAPRLHLLAVRRGEDAWEDGPAPESRLETGDQLVYTGGPDVRHAVERLAWSD